MLLQCISMHHRQCINTVHQYQNQYQCTNKKMHQYQCTNAPTAPSMQMHEHQQCTNARARLQVQRATEHEQLKAEHEQLAAETHALKPDNGTLADV